MSRCAGHYSGSSLSAFSACVCVCAFVAICPAIVQRVYNFKWKMSFNIHNSVVSMCARIIKIHDNFFSLCTFCLLFVNSHSLALAHTHKHNFLSTASDWSVTKWKQTNIQRNEYTILKRWNIGANLLCFGVTTQMCTVERKIVCEKERVQDEWGMTETGRLGK